MAAPISGIYRIRNLVNGRRYIGRSVNIQTRFKDHKRLLRKGKHNQVFQDDWDNLGTAAFVFEVLLECHESQHIKREQCLLSLHPEYNVGFWAGSPGAGVRRSAETRKRMSDAKKGKPMPADYMATVSALRKGQNLGARQSPETIARRVATRRARNGYSISEETRAKMRAAKLGTKQSAETRAKGSAARKGRTISAEARERRRDAQSAARGIAVEAICLVSGQVLHVFRCLRDAERAGFTAECISRCLRGEARKHRGLFWRRLQTLTGAIG